MENFQKDQEKLINNQVKLTIEPPFVNLNPPSRNPGSAPELFTWWPDFCHLLITFSSSLDPDQAQQNVGPDLDQKCLTL